MNKSRSLYGSAALCGLAIALHGGTANAQTEGDAEEDQVRVIDTVIVTAQKKAESSQDVPIALTVFGEDAIEEQNIVSIEDLTRFTPGLYVGQADQSRTRIVMRGVGSQKFDVGADPSVGVFVDEIYISRFSGQEFNLLDIGRIEVLKGPQGTLFGRNTPGGAISIVSQEPSADDVTGFLEGGLSDRGGYLVRGAVSGPISDKVSGSASFGQQFTGGYIENPTTGVDDDETTSAARGKLVLDATDTLTISGSLQYTDLDAESNAASSAATLDGGLTIPLFGFPPGAPVPAATDPYNHAINEDGFVEIEALLGILRVDKEIGDFTLTSLSSYRDSEAEQLGDFDRTNTPIGLTTFEEESETLSQEFRISSQNLFGGSFVAGFFYYLDDAFRDDGFLWQGASLPVNIALMNPMIPFTGTEIQDNTIVDVETESIAVFGQIEFPITDQLRLTLGGRYTSETKDYTMSGRTDVPMLPAVVENYEFSDDLDFDTFDPKVVVEYDVNEDVLIYGSYTQGFKSGGVQFNASSRALAELTFDPEEIDAFEIGVKSDLLDGRMRFNASAFLYDYKDLQQQRVEVTATGPAAVTRNAAEAEIQGFEFDTTYAITDEFLVRLAYNYLDATYEEFGIFSGNTMQNAPENTLSATLDYQKTLQNGWTIGAATDWFYQDSFFFDFTNDDPVTEEDAYTTGQVRLIFTAPEDKYSVTLYGENITDEEFRSSVFRRDTEVVEGWADGFRYGARLRFNF